jgi:hypothetical protein
MLFNMAKVSTNARYNFKIVVFSNCSNTVLTVLKYFTVWSSKIINRKRFAAVSTV